MAIDREDDLEESLSELQRLISRLDGVESFVAISEGFPIVYAGISYERAEVLSAMAVDLTVTGDELLRDIQDKLSNPREIMVILDGNRVIDVTKAKNLLLAFQGQKKIVEEVSSISVKHMQGEEMNCPYCNFNLLLEVHKCTKCKKNIPFKSSICPYCGALNKIKKCSKCKNIITNDMKKVKITKTREMKLSAILEGAAASIVFGWIGFVTISLATGLISGIVAGALTGFLAYKYAKPEYKIES